MDIKTMCTANNKGGIGKSITVQCLAEILAFLDKKVLLIDQDPNSNLSRAFGNLKIDSEAVLEGRILPDEKEWNISELYNFRLTKREEVLPLIKPTQIENIFIIPSSKRHVQTIKKMLISGSSGNMETILSRAVKSIMDLFDYIIIDNPGEDDLMVTNAIIASQLVLIPVQTERNSQKGLVEIVSRINKLKEVYDLDLTYRAFIVNVNPRTTLYKEYVETYIKIIPEYFINYPIRPDANAVRVLDSEKPISVLDKYYRARFVQDYIKLINGLDILSAKSIKKLKSIMNQNN